MWWRWVCLPLLGMTRCILQWCDLLSNYFAHFFVLMRNACMYMCRSKIQGTGEEMKRPITVVMNMIQYTPYLAGILRHFTIAVELHHLLAVPPTQMAQQLLLYFTNGTARLIFAVPFLLHAQEGCRVLESACLYDCLLAYLKNHMSKLHNFFIHVCYLWLWYSHLLTTALYIVCFWSCGW